MIAQVLNREFLLEAAGLLEGELERELAARSEPRRRGMPTPVDELETHELTAVIDDLRRARGAEGEGAAELDDGAASKDDFAYVPREPLLSLLQTTIDEHVEESDVEVVDSPVPGGRREPGGKPAVTDRRIAEVPLVAAHPSEGGRGRRKWGDMEIAKFKLFSDPGWLTSGFAMGVRLFRGRAEWVDAPPVVPIANDAQIILVGDWGSGIPRAKDVSDRIQDVFEEDPRRERHVVHLGDVYYSGSKREYERNFLNLWPVGKGNTDIGSFSLCGNHDMYYGGHAYYGTLLAEPRLARQGGCSYFALKNDHWQLLGLDTGYEDGGLNGHQAQWARELIDSAPNHKTALLTHHQLFSAHESGAKKLQEKIEPVLASERIDAWFWGHEHRCIQYEATEWNGHRVGFASCLGHGGVPEYLVMKEGETKDPPWAYEYLKPFGTPDEPWEKFGFAVLDLDGPQMSIRYIDEEGTQHHQVDKVVKGR
jgi:predicted phosphodiesterase